MSSYFVDSDIDYIGHNCLKLHPTLRSYNEEGRPDFVLFEPHSLCIIKDEHKYVICNYLGEDDSEVLGEILSKPFNTIEETVFAILAILTDRLPKHIAKQLIYEPGPINYQ